MGNPEAEREKADVAELNEINATLDTLLADAKATAAEVEAEYRATPWLERVEYRLWCWRHFRWK